MFALKHQLSGLVYSTSQGELCPGCGESPTACKCNALADEAYLAQLDGWVKIKRVTKGRKGKGVTLIEDLPLTSDELKALAKELKAKCATGGAVKDRVIEIQGDNRKLLQPLLEAKGYKLKFIGG